MDQVVEHAYLWARGAQASYYVLQEFALARFPYGLQIILASTVINATMMVYAANKDKPRLYWLHSLVQVVLSGFGGGIITPVILGTKPSIIFMNEAVIPMCVLIWYLVNYCGFDRVFNWKPVKLLWNIVVSVWRCNGTVNTINAACANFTKSGYYPTPLMGPLIGGTLINSLGAFVPFDKGLGPIQKGTPWPIQSAFVSSALYFFIVKDRDGFVGIAVRSVVGDLSGNVVASIIVGMQVLTLSSQVIFDDPSANFLTPIHQLVYYVFQLQGPPTAAVPAVVDATQKTDHTAKQPKGFTFQEFVIYVRVAIVALFGIYFLGLRIPPVSLPAVSTVEVFQLNGASHVTFNTASGGLTVAQPVGACQWVQLLPFAAPQCSPHRLQLEEHHICTNDTCGASLSSADALQRNVISNLKFRLAVHPVAGAAVGAPSRIQTTTADDLYAINSNLEWSTALPLDVTSAQQLHSVDPQYGIGNVALYLTKTSELFLVSHVVFNGTIFQPAQLTARVLWSGMPEITCANRAFEEGGVPSMGSAETEALYLDDASGAPRIRCSDGSSVEMIVGEVYKPAVQQYIDQPAIPATAAVASGIKAEL